VSRIFWDTNLFIYLFEDHGRFSSHVLRLRRRMRERGDELYTSALTLGEVLVKPIEKGDLVLRETYESVLGTETSVMPFDVEAAGVYAAIRTDRTIKPPDAIQLACAARARVDLFVTNDDHLSRKNVPGISFICGLERAPI